MRSVASFIAHFLHKVVKDGMSSIIITVIVGIVALGLGFASMAKAVGRVFEKIKDTLQ
ncbi:MAG: hypothetical protein IKJ68_03060 [Clostridia bacterium]|nr:hypothetical protein [Clostridia bacterium]